MVISYSKYASALIFESLCVIWFESVCVIWFESVCDKVSRERV
jgi:hypothetical protein